MFKQLLRGGHDVVTLGDLSMSFRDAVWGGSCIQGSINSTLQLILTGFRHLVFFLSPTTHFPRTSVSASCYNTSGLDGVAARTRWIDRFTRSLDVSMPKLSIITINLNNVSGLEKTICSVISQTFHDFEYIVIDGGSTDGSVDVIRKYADKLTYWVSEPDAGIYNAMNKGIRNASGEYCQFLNSGDWLIAPNVTERMLKDMPDCAILYGNMITMQNGEKNVHKGFEGKPITLANLFRSTINHSPAYIRRDLFGKYGLYDETLKIVSDWKFFLIAVGLNNELVAYHDVNVAIFDMNGLSNLNPDLCIKERQIVIRDLINNNIIRDLEEFASFWDIFWRLKKHPWVWFIVRFLNIAIRKCEKHL